MTPSPNTEVEINPEYEKIRERSVVYLFDRYDLTTIEGITDFGMACFDRGWEKAFLELKQFNHEDDQ